MCWANLLPATQILADCGVMHVSVIPHAGAVPLLIHKLLSLQLCKCVISSVQSVALFYNGFPCTAFRKRLSVLVFQSTGVCEIWFSLGFLGAFSALKRSRLLL